MCTKEKTKQASTNNKFSPLLTTVGPTLHTNLEKFRIGAFQKHPSTRKRFETLRFSMVGKQFLEISFS